MVDAISNLLGLLPARGDPQRAEDRAAGLFLSLPILAVPALDATFVVAKRIKYGRWPVYSAD